MLTFQEIIQRLTTFWGDLGCVIHQGHDVEVGAGTFNPATFLRSLGQEPYCTAYVEPSRRPSDGRYGKNPNRVHCFHQFQVILKPSPENVLKLYLESLEALGLDLKKHDIRFVHDDWESPTVGAWGLGWEVWCDGMEITQFTYFQAMGSLALYPISAEITYGLERLAMYIQNKDHIFDVQWNKNLTLGDIAKENEIEWSSYNFEKASIPLWKTHFDDFEKEASSLIAQDLPLPAYDFVIKASHAFNVLQARGAISVTERTGYIARIRDLSRQIALAYVESRERLGFPLLKKEKNLPLKKSKQSKINLKFHPEKKRDFLLEIGSEQLPATFIPAGLASLEKRIKEFCSKYSLSFTSCEMFGSPQRLGIVLKDLSEGVPEKEIERRGPPVSSAFTKEGVLTPQGEGFCRSLGQKTASLQEIQKGKIPELEIREFKGVEYLFVTVTEQGRSTFSLFAEALPDLIGNIDFPKKMHWDESRVSYARPVRWIVALFGKEIVPFSFGAVASDRISRGHAQYSPVGISIPSPTQFFSLLKKHKVIAKIEERKEEIVEQLKKWEKENNWQIVEQEKVMSEVLFLTEWPTVVPGAFDSHFLSAPQEVLISEMVEHQKYFPVADRKGKLLPSFLITTDHKPGALITKGNERVLSARLSDGVFLYEQDLGSALEKNNEKLKIMVHQKDLGSMFDKVLRVQKIALLVHKALSLGIEDQIDRASLLSKADLASALVGEFPELQGTIGKYLALAQGEKKEVALAIEEQWMPRGEGSPLPSSENGIVLSIADKIDNLIGCYSVNLKPSSSSDPYALRRQAMGIMKMLIAQKKRVDLSSLLTQCMSCFSHVENSTLLVQEILSFIGARAISVFEEFGFKKEEIDACLQGKSIDPYDEFCKIEALHLFRKSGKEFAKLCEVYKRAKGQLEKPSGVPFSTDLLQERAEKQLASFLKEVESGWKKLLSSGEYLKAFQSIATLQEPLSCFFDEVRILCEDKQLSENRIALLQKVFALFRELVDFSKV